LSDLARWLSGRRAVVRFPIRWSDQRRAVVHETGSEPAIGRSPNVEAVSDGDEEPTGAEQVADSPRERRLELVVTILLAAGALLSAWCAYQSARFSSQANDGHAEAIRLQVDATAADNAVSRVMLVDVTVFSEWVDATASGDRDRASFLRERFRDEMKPAFEAWVASGGIGDLDAEATPFQLPEYRLAKAEEAAALQVAAEKAALLYAAALFQLGIQSRVGVFELRRALVVVSGCIVIGTTVWIVTLPR
jgi:hypothetical protein